MRYWMYKTNRNWQRQGFVGGDWRSDLFAATEPCWWGGSRATTSTEALLNLRELMSEGDVIVCYQTDEKAVIGFAQIERIDGPDDDREVWLTAIQLLDPPFAIHTAKKGTPLEHSTGITGPIMVREIEKADMKQIVKLAGASERVLRGMPSGQSQEPSSP